MSTPNKWDPMLPHGSDKCKCAACGEYFNSTYAFDKHRYGPYTSGRNCGSRDQMMGMGMVQAPSGHWVSSSLTARALRRRMAA